jgi:hypothetical protein
MPAPTTSDELLARARTALGRKIPYALGKGGFKPEDSTPNRPNGGCDCSGFVSWALGISRETTNPFYKEKNGGWIETSAVYADIGSPIGLFSSLATPRPGCIVVYPDSPAGGEGHIGIVTKVSAAGAVTAVIHCSSSGWKNQGDSIQENAPSALTKNPSVRYGWYAGLDQPLAATTATDSANALAPAAATEASTLAVRFSVKESDGIYTHAWGFPDESPFFFQSRLHVCADGAPDAYGPGDIGTDYLANAGTPPFKGAPTDRDLHLWKWFGVVVGPGNKPVAQKNSDPNPGYFVSPTAHGNWGTHKETDPRCYVNANEVAYLVLPRGHKGGAKLGDFGYIIHRPTGTAIPAIWSEVGPADETGEASILAVNQLGFKGNPRKGGSGKREFLYLVFPGTGNGKPRTQTDIQKNANALFTAWGGIARANSLPGNLSGR